MTNILKHSAALRAALVSLVAAVGVGAVSSAAHALPTGLDKGSAVGRTRNVLLATSITRTATSNFINTTVGQRGTVMLCGGAATGLRSISCNEAEKCIGTRCTGTTSSTNTQAMPYASSLQLLLHDANNDDTLTWNDVDIVLVCDDIFGQQQKFTYTNRDLTETTGILGADDNGRKPFCSRVRSFSASNNSTIPSCGADVACTYADYYATLDSSDSLRLVTTEEVVLPVAPIRSVASAVDAICITRPGLHLVGAGAEVCHKAAQCGTTGLISGGRGGAYVQLTSCFTTGDPSTVTIEGSSVSVRVRAGTY